MECVSISDTPPTAMYVNRKYQTVDQPTVYNVQQQLTHLIMTEVGKWIWQTRSHTRSSAHGMLSNDVPIIVFQMENLQKDKNQYAKIHAQRHYNIKFQLKTTNKQPHLMGLNEG